MLFLQFWNDPRLSWDKSEFENISQVIINPKKAWLPDVVLLNRCEYDVESDITRFQSYHLLTITTTIIIYNLYYHYHIRHRHYHHHRRRRHLYDVTDIINVTITIIITKNQHRYIITTS